jgi:hypothetical protein
LGSDKFKVERERERESYWNCATEFLVAHTKHNFANNIWLGESKKIAFSCTLSKHTFVFQEQEKETGKRLPSRD